jgi:hypothetical protein
MLGRMQERSGGKVNRRGATGMFAAALGVLGVLGCGSSAPILLHPKMPNVTSGAECPGYRSPFTLTRVEDKRGYANDRNLGFTQTGLFNVKASLETERPTVSFVAESIRAALERCGLWASGAMGRPLAVDLMTFQVMESDTFTTETMTSSVRYEVLALDPSTKTPVARFMVTGTSKHSGIDTSDYAEQVISEAMAASIPAFLKQLPPPPAATTIAAAAPPAPVVADASEIPVRFSFRPIAKHDQEQRFGTTLADKEVLAIEMHVERAQGEPHGLIFRRQDFRLIFADGTARFPLDQLKVQERHRKQMPIMFYTGGLFIMAGSMESMADTKGLDAEVDTLTFGPKRRALDGVLFFDLENATSSPANIEAAFEDAATHRMLHGLVPLPAK